MLQFQNTLSVADIINLVLLTATVITVILAYRQVKDSDKTRKATFFNEFYQTIFSDPNMLRGYRLIEYNEFTYDNNHFCGRESDEIAIDRMLNLYNLICYLSDQGLLSEDEMDLWKYRFLLVYRSPDIQRYIDFIEVWYLSQGIRIKMYQNFRSYCAKHQHQEVQHLTVDQAYWFYKEQKSRLDNLLLVAEQQLPPEGNAQSEVERQLQALDMLKACLQDPRSWHQENALCKALRESGVYGPFWCVVAGLEALKAKLQRDENSKQHKDMHNIIDTITLKKL